MSTIYLATVIYDNGVDIAWYKVACIASNQIEAERKIRQRFEKSMDDIVQIEKIKSMKSTDVICEKMPQQLS